MAVHVFKNPQTVEEMLILRREGWTIQHLALKYHCTPAVIFRTCEKNNLHNIQIRMIPVVLFKRVLILDGERINLGKSYREYLKEKGIKQPKREKETI